MGKEKKTNKFPPLVGGRAKFYMEEERKKLRSFDIISIPMVNSSIKDEMVDKLNMYLDNGYVVINVYDIVENNQAYVAYAVANNNIGNNGQVRVQGMPTSISSEYSFQTVSKGSGVSFEDTMYSHKKKDRNNSRNRLKLDVEYKDNPPKLYLFYSVAIARLEAAIAERKQIYAYFSNEALKTIIDNGYNTRLELETVEELKKKQFDKCADLIINALLPAYADINRGLTDDMLKNKDAEWHRLAKEHEAIKKELKGE